jgi:hypothetical protein
VKQEKISRVQVRSYSAGRVAVDVAQLMADEAITEMRRLCKDDNGVHFVETVVKETSRSAVGDGKPHCIPFTRNESS